MLEKLHCHQKCSPMHHAQRKEMLKRRYVYTECGWGVGASSLAEDPHTPVHTLLGPLLVFKRQLVDVLKNVPACSRTRMYSGVPHTPLSGRGLIQLVFGGWRMGMQRGRGYGACWCTQSKSWRMGRVGEWGRRVVARLEVLWQRLRASGQGHILQALVGATLSKLMVC